MVKKIKRILKDVMRLRACNFCRYNGTGTFDFWVQFRSSKFHLFENGTSSVPVPSKLELVPELGTSSSVTPLPSRALDSPHALLPEHCTSSFVQNTTALKGLLFFFVRVKK